MTLDDMVALPWSWEGPREVQDDGNTYFELVIRELPDFFVAGKSRDEVLAEAVPALTEFLRSYLDNHEVPPLPDSRNWRFSVISLVRPAANSGVAAEIKFPGSGLQGATA